MVLILSCHTAMLALIKLSFAASSNVIVKEQTWCDAGASEAKKEIKNGLRTSYRIGTHKN